VVASRLSTGTINLHGWMYKIATGEVFTYDSEVSQYVKFGSDDVKPANDHAEDGRGEKPLRGPRR
jgi:carbonic anhydrase